MPKKIKKRESDKIKEAEKIVKQAMEKRMKKCNEEINAVLRKHKFTFDVQAHIRLIPAQQQQQPQQPQQEPPEEEE
jgi:hypothetical protein